MLSLVHNYIIPAAYAVLPAPMKSPRATAMLLAIALQESRCEHRKQIGGPARGFWQFEAGGGTWGVKNHALTRNQLKAAMILLRYPTTLTHTEIHARLEHNDVLAAVCARLLLWTLPRSLPQRGDFNGSWAQYISGWRPGKPHRATWNDYYARAWDMVVEAERQEISRAIFELAIDEPRLIIRTLSEVGDDCNGLVYDYRDAASGDSDPSGKDHRIRASKRSPAEERTR